MAKTDKTKSLKFRMDEPGFDWDYVSWEERGLGPKYVRWAKRFRSKKNRRSDFPVTSMESGRGWGSDNMKRGYN